MANLVLSGGLGYRQTGPIYGLKQGVRQTKEEEQISIPFIKKASQDEEK